VLRSHDHDGFMDNFMWCLPPYVQYFVGQNAGLF